MSDVRRSGTTATTDRTRSGYRCPDRPAAACGSRALRVAGARLEGGGLLSGEHGLAGKLRGPFERREGRTRPGAVQVGRTPRCARRMRSRTLRLPRHWAPPSPRHDGAHETDRREASRHHGPTSLVRTCPPLSYWSSGTAPHPGQVIGLVDDLDEGSRSISSVRDARSSSASGTATDGCGSHARQCEDERRALSRPRLKMTCTLIRVQRDDSRAIARPSPSPPCSRVGARVLLPESLEHVRQEVGTDPAPGVGDDELDAIAVASTLTSTLPPGGVNFTAFESRLFDHLLEPLRVAADDRARRRRAPRVRRNATSSRRGAGERVDRGLATTGRKFTGCGSQRASAR